MLDTEKRSRAEQKAQQKTVSGYILDRLMDTPGMTGQQLLVGRPPYIASGSVAPALLALHDRGVVRRSKVTTVGGRGTYAYWIQDLDKLPKGFTEVRTRAPARKVAAGVTVVKSFTEAAEVIDNRSSLISEGSVLNHIRLHPGCSSSEILSALNPEDRTNKIFAVLSRLERDGKILAESVVENERRKRRFYTVAAYAPRSAPPAPTPQQPATPAPVAAARPSDPPKTVHPVKGAPILRVAVGDRSYSMTVSEWREVYEELKAVFG